MVFRMSTKVNTEVVPEYEKSLLSWKGKPVLTSAPQVKIVSVVHRAPAPTPRVFPPATSRTTSGSSSGASSSSRGRSGSPTRTQAPTHKRASLSTGSMTPWFSSPSHSSPTPVAFAAGTGAAGAEIVGNGSSFASSSAFPSNPASYPTHLHYYPPSPSNPPLSPLSLSSPHRIFTMQTTRDASPPSSKKEIDASDALLSLAAFPRSSTSPPNSKRAREGTSTFELSTGTEGLVAQVEAKKEDVSLGPSPPKRLKKNNDASFRATTASPSASPSAGTSRASSPAPSAKSSGLKKATSRTKTGKTGGEGTAKKVKRRKKRPLTDLRLPPKKGTYRGLSPVVVRSVSTPGSMTACDSDTPAAITATSPQQKPSVQRQTWCDDDGYVRYQLKTSEDVVRDLTKMGRYRTCFKNPCDPNDKSFELMEYPVVDLEYLNDGARETFLLLRPKDPDHYDPTYDIENTLKTLVKDVIPPEYKDIFGPLPEDALLNIPDHDDSDNDAPMSLPSEFASINDLRVSRTPASSTLAEDSDFASPPSQTSSPRYSPSPKGLLKTLIRARARHDGPTYTATLKEINRCIRELKNRPSSGNILRRVPHSWSTGGIPQGVIGQILEETYQRCVGPQINQLRKYEAFSSNVYGELTPAFVNDIIEKTRLRPDSIFLDLGSGVGNVVLQVALQVGCFAFGIEQREDAACIADDQLEQIQLRCRMWGVSMGEVELVQGDMTSSSRVDELMSKADVVLVNNYVFTEELNAALRPKFLDLKEGAMVVSLKPFAPLPSASQKFKLLTERNFDDISAIFEVSAHPYHSGTVSWSSGNGTYYVHDVNRELYRKSREAFEDSLRKRRSTRR